MKLCFLANVDDNHCRKWIGYFADRGHEIHLLSRPSDHVRELQRPNITFYPLRASSIKFLDVVLNAVRVRKLVRKIKPDVLHALYAGVSASKIRFIYWGTDIEKFRPGPRNEKLRQRLEIFDAPLVISLRNLEPAY